MSNPESSLPESWVKRIFSTMRATYGASLDRQWECPAGVDPLEHAQTMLAHWGRELRGYQQNPAAISYALENLPEYPPNLIEFRALCRRRPDSDQQRLEAPKVLPAEMIAAVAGIAKPVPKEDAKQWARDLQQREKNGASLTLAQRGMWREALKNDFGPLEQFSPGAVISDADLPPAMRNGQQ